MTEKTIFKRIIDKEIPSKIVYEDELCLAFNDVSPQAPVHVLIIPKTTDICSTNDVNEDNSFIIGHIFCVIPKIAKVLGVSDDGYRVVTNCGKSACQTVPHLHFHIIGGRDFTWPPG